MRCEIFIRDQHLRKGTEAGLAKERILKGRLGKLGPSGRELRGGHLTSEVSCLRTAGNPYPHLA